MTYCVAIQVNEGLAFVSDSRTNAGVDQLSTYSKMFTFEVPSQRTLVVLTAGNLATTQAVIKNLRRDIDDGSLTNLFNVGSLDEAASYIGRLNVEQQNKHVSQLAGNKLDVTASFIVGGQIGGAGLELYLVYPEGNFIAATEQNPYQQIGEMKYGKPILDRIISCTTPLADAALCGLVSMDSTMRSNATVGPPIELLVYHQNSLSLPPRVRYDRDDPYLLSLRKAWEAELARGFNALPPLIMNPGAPN